VQAAYVISDCLRVYETAKLGDFFFFKLTTCSSASDTSVRPAGAIPADRLPAQRAPRLTALAFPVTSAEQKFRVGNPSPDTRQTGAAVSRGQSGAQRQPCSPELHDAASSRPRVQPPARSRWGRRLQPLRWDSPACHRKRTGLSARQAPSKTTAASGARLLLSRGQQGLSPARGNAALTACFCRVHMAELKRNFCSLHSRFRAGCHVMRVHPALRL